MRMGFSPMLAVPVQLDFFAAESCGLKDSQPVAIVESECQVVDGHGMINGITHIDRS
jgi:hypothetical protein